MPFGIPVNAKIVFRGIKNDASKFVRGNMIFRSASVSDPHRENFDFNLPYQNIVFPGVVDAENKNNRNVGEQSIEFKGASQQLNTTLLGFKISNKSRNCLLYTSPSPRDKRQSRMPSSA